MLRLTPDKMRTVSSLVCSSLSFCFTSTGRAFQYKVEAVCTSKLSQDLVLLSITSGIAPLTGPRSSQGQGFETWTLLPNLAHHTASRNPMQSRRLPRFRCKNVQNSQIRMTRNESFRRASWAMTHGVMASTKGCVACAIAPGARVPVANTISSSAHDTEFVVSGAVDPKDSAAA